MKKTTKTIVEEFDDKGNLLKKTETTTTEEDNNTYVPWTPINPYVPTYPDNPWIYPTYVHTGDTPNIKFNDKITCDSKTDIDNIKSEIINAFDNIKIKSGFSL
jgi:hypothetical protein